LGGILEQQYESMRAWVEYVNSRAGETHVWTGDFQFGDWLDPSAPLDRPERGQTDPDLVATAYFARSARLLSLAARAIGRDQDAVHYAELSNAIGQAFRDTYLTHDGQLSSDSQAAYCLALEFDLLPIAAEREQAAARLAELVRAADHRIGTGFLATPFMCDALASSGYVDDAYALLLQEECPSWLYQVRQGATTIWERWDSLLPDGTVNPGDMTSFNHFAFGAVVDWLHRSVAGLAPGSPGYANIVVRPLVGGGLSHARAKHMTPYGLAEAGWRIAGDQLEIEAVVPQGATATVHIPGAAAPVEVAAGTHYWNVAWPASPTSVPAQAAIS